MRIEKERLVEREWDRVNCLVWQCEHLSQSVVSDFL